MNSIKQNIECTNRHINTREKKRGRLSLKKMNSLSWTNKIMGKKNIEAERIVKFELFAEKK